MDLSVLPPGELNALGHAAFDAASNPLLYQRFGHLGVDCHVAIVTATGPVEGRIVHRQSRCPCISAEIKTAGLEKAELRALAGLGANRRNLFVGCYTPNLSLARLVETYLLELIESAVDIAIAQAPDRVAQAA